jgi:hypothetical protein
MGGSVSDLPRGGKMFPFRRPLPKQLDPADIDRITLISGPGKRRRDELCIMTLVAWLRGEDHTAHPEVGPTSGFRRIAMAINDRASDAERQRLKGIAPMLADFHPTEVTLDLASAKLFNTPHWQDRIDENTSVDLFIVFVQATYHYMRDTPEEPKDFTDVRQGIPRRRGARSRPQPCDLGSAEPDEPSRPARLAGMPQALYTDQYCLTMAQYWWEENLDDTVSFELFVRRLPTTRSYLVVAGLGTALWHLRNFGFTREEFDFLYSMESPEGRPLFKPDFVRFLRELDFTCDVWAIPEGTPVGPQTPILRVTGPRIQATLIESLLLATINHQTMIASKVARIVEAADGRPVWDFSLRRLHGVDASLGVARAAYIAGAAGTATVEAGRILKIPTTGTMAHAMVMAYGEDHEQTVFEKVMQSFPSNHALLVDTYDTYRGVMRAIAAAKHTDIPLRAIRLDSDLARDRTAGRCTARRCSRGRRGSPVQGHSHHRLRRPR